MRIAVLSVTLWRALAASDPSALDIVRESALRDERNFQIQQSYTWRETSDLKMFNRQGGTKKHEIKTHEILWIDGARHQRLVARDGRPLNEQDARKEQEKLDREIEKRRVLPKMAGVVWIDKRDYEWARVEAETLDTLTFGLGVARVAKGAQISVMQSLVNGEFWAPQWFRIALNARALLLVGANLELNLRFSDYRKYSVDSRITEVSETP